MLARAFLAALALSAAPKEGPLSELVAHLDLKHCDEAFELISAVEVPPRADPELAHAARAIVRGAASCKSDPPMALAFTGLAARLAPEDPTVLLEHATLLVTVKHRAEASELLERIIAKYPDSFAKARLLRARVAAEEADLELAIQLLAPLAADPASKAEAEPLLAQCRAQWQAQKATEGEPAQREARAVERPQREPKGGKGRRESESTQPRSLDQPSPDAGKLVSNLSGKVSLGGEHTFSVKGLRKGQNYTFKASGECSRKAKKGKRKKGGMVEDPNRSIFGIDFAVQFGQQEPRTLAAGQGEAELNEIGFTADADAIPVRVFDRSNVEKDVACTFTGFSVVVR
ncbi:MAG TPA: hypothetical protein VGK67_27420 [Myxococcales bacterium]|jgi:hypothetical protein